MYWTVGDPQAALGYYAEERFHSASGGERKFSTRILVCMMVSRFQMCICSLIMIINYDRQKLGGFSPQHNNNTLCWLGRAALYNLLALVLFYSVYGTGNSHPKSPAAQPREIDSSSSKHPIHPSIRLARPTSHYPHCSIKPHTAFSVYRLKWDTGTALAPGGGGDSDRG